jgi:hypothetical protein
MRWRSAARELAAVGFPVAALSAGLDLCDDGTLVRRYGLGDRGAVLVRPDGHCAAALPDVTEGHLEALTAAVDAVLGIDRMPPRPVKESPVTGSDLAERPFAVWLDPPADDAAGLAAFPFRSLETVADGRIAAVYVVGDELGNLLGLDTLTPRGREDRTVALSRRP